MATQVSAINEVVAISGSIFSNYLNVKYYDNVASASTDANLGGYWQTIYDSSPTSSLSTPLFDMTFGIATGSDKNVSVTTTSSLTEKIKIYRHFANILLGNADSVFQINSQDKQELFFIALKRNIHKDELKKGTVALTLNSVAAIQYTASDAGAATNFKQANGGEYAPIKSGTVEIGQVWYNAGMILLDPITAFGDSTWSGSVKLENTQCSGTINQNVDGLRSHIERIDFHNQTNLYSTIYFCRATNTEFNYSSNPTFIDDNQRIRVTSGSNVLQTRTYITTVGLYDANDNLLACAKVNKPIMKSPDTESIFRIRLDW